jgi:hypothetical protein
MIETIQNFLRDRLIELKRGYGQPVPYLDTNIFFTELPRDFLKDNDYAACCLKLQDRKKKDGRIISRERNADCTLYTFTRRRYRRELLYRCFLHASTYDDLWGADGLVDQFEKAIAKFRVLADSNNRAIKIELHDSVQPSGAQAEQDRKKKRPYTAIIRVGFSGGIYTSWTAQIIPSIEFTSEIQ